MSEEKKPNAFEAFVGNPEHSHALEKLEEKAEPEFPDYVGIQNDLLKPEPVVCKEYPGMTFAQGYLSGFIAHATESDKPERIVGVAISILKNRQPYLFVGYPQARHHNLIAMMVEVRGDEYRPPSAADKLFLTSHGRAVPRVQARVIAESRGQLLKTAINSPHLFSEDIW